jgi:MipA family protein
MLRVHARITVFALTLLAATAANAAERDPSADPDSGEESKSYSWGLGVAGLTQQLAYAGIERENIAAPLIYFESQWLSLLGPNLDFKLPELKWGEEQEFGFSIRTQLFGFGGYEAEDAPILSDMEERKAGITVGPAFQWSNPIVEVVGEWMFDVSQNSEGQRASLGLQRRFEVGKRFALTPSVSAIWMDSKYADYYYGVRSAEARADRPAYILEDGAVNSEVALRADYMLDERQTFFVNVTYTQLDSKIKDSPLIDRSGETMLFAGYLYRFR